MKKVISIGLIILMSVQSFYKLGVITYFQLNRDYIAEVLCINKEKPITMCYGQCFLDKNLDLANDAPQSTVPVGKEKIDIPVFITSENIYSFQLSSPAAELNTRYFFSSISVALAPPFHPPAVG